MISAPTTEQPKLRSRRDFLRTTVLAGAGVLALGSYSTVIEPNHLDVKALDIWLERLPSAFDGFRIAQVSDIHYGEFLGEDHVKAVVALTNGAKPDLVALTGDFVTRHSLSRRKFHAPDARVAEPCARVLQDLRPRLGTVGVLGNHDHTSDPDFVAYALISHGMRVLRNQAYPIEIGNARIWLAGIDDVLERAGDIDGTMAKVPREEACVVLVHEPDVADSVARYPVDLQLSGHSHGGQVRIPLLGAPILPPLARKYPLGQYSVGKMQLYTNPGVGLIDLPVRFDCPPEITVFTLRAGRRA